MREEGEDDDSSGDDNDPDSALFIVPGIGRDRWLVSSSRGVIAMMPFARLVLVFPIEYVLGF